MTESNSPSSGWRYALVIGIVVLGGWALFLGKRVTDRISTVPDHARELLDAQGDTRVLRCPVPGGTEGLPETVRVSVGRATDSVTAWRRAHGSFREGHLVIAGAAETGTGRLLLEDRGLAEFTWEGDTCTEVVFGPVPEPPTDGPPADPEAGEP